MLPGKGSEERISRGGCGEQAGAPISSVTIAGNWCVVKRNILLVSYSFERIGKLLEERELRLAALQAGCGVIIHDSRGGRGIRSHWKESPEIPVRSKNQGDGHDLRNAASGPNDGFE